MQDILGLKKFILSSRWQVKFYSPTGKPLKPRLSLNKDERKNDKCFSTFIGFCGGTVDVLADSRNYSIEVSSAYMHIFSISIISVASALF